MTLQRKDYLDGKITHEQYYAQFVTPSIIEFVARHIGKKRIAESKDEHLNDIPLHEWDNLFTYQAFKDVLPNLRDSGDVNANSLANAVCIAKAAARMLVSKEAA